MPSRALIAICCVLLFAGCAPTMTQHRNMWQAINDRTSLTGFGKNYFIHEFGFPYSRSVSSSGGVRVETWTYQTNLKDKYLIINMRPAKTRSLKINFIDDIATDATFEQ